MPTKHPLPYIDFTTPQMVYRLQRASLKNELLARAIGIKPTVCTYIIDATAGLGRDSFLLATLGYQVLMLERSQLLFNQLQDGIARAHEYSLTRAAANRLTLVHADAISYLNALNTDRPDVIYLDPMFPTKQKTAAVRKELVTLQELIGPDLDAEQLLSTALACAVKRVVVKRPRLDKKTLGITPHFSLAGSSSRFDIYLV